MNANGFQRKMNELKDNLKAMIEASEQKGSGFTMQRVNHLVINQHQLNPLSASSYIQAPSKLSLRQCVINVENQDHMCFKWAVLTALHYYDVPRDREGISAYREYKKLYDWSMLEFPVYACRDHLQHALLQSSGE